MTNVKKVTIETENHTITLKEKGVKIHPDIKYMEEIGIKNDILIYSIGNFLGWNNVNEIRERNSGKD